MTTWNGLWRLFKEKRSEAAVRGSPKCMFGPFLAFALRAPLQDERWRQKILLGGLLSLLPTLASFLALFMALGKVTVMLAPVAVVFFVVPTLVTWGYVYRVFVDALNGLEFRRLPEWGAWRQYAVAGVRLGIIFLGYFFLVGLGTLAVMAVLGLIPPGEDPTRLSAVTLLAIGAAMMLYGLLPVVFARFAAERKVWASFDPGAIWSDIRRVVRGGRYTQACLALYALYGLLFLSNIILAAIPPVAMIVVSVGSFYLMVVFAWVFGWLIGVRGAERSNR